jgi:hypothetical protein
MTNAHPANCPTENYFSISESGSGSNVNVERSKRHPQSHKGIASFKLTRPRIGSHRGKNVCR